jgi:hypothetical protein
MLCCIVKKVRGFADLKKIADLWTGTRTEFVILRLRNDPKNLKISEKDVCVHLWVEE